MEYKRPDWYPDEHGNMRWWNGVSWGETNTQPHTSPPVQSQDQYVNKKATPLPRSIRRTLFWVFGFVAASVTIPIIVVAFALFSNSRSNSDPAEILNYLIANQDCDTLQNNMSEAMLYLTIGADNCTSVSPEQVSKFTAFVKFYDPSSPTVSISYMKTSEYATITVTPQNNPEAAASFEFTKERNGILKNWVLNYIVYENFDKAWYAGDPGQPPPSVSDCIASIDYSRLISTSELERAASQGAVEAYCKYYVEYDSDFAGGLQPVTVIFDDPEPGEAGPTSADVTIFIGGSQKTVTSRTYFHNGKWG